MAAPESSGTTALCVSVQKEVSKRQNDNYKSHLLEDTCEAYKQVGEGMPCPKNFLDYSFIIKEKVGRERRTSLSFLSRRCASIISSFCHASIISSSSSWAGEFSCPYVVKLSPQISGFFFFFHVCKKHILGIINLLSSLCRYGSHAIIVLVFGGISHASVAWFCC